MTEEAKPEYIFGQFQIQDKITYNDITDYESLLEILCISRSYLLEGVLIALKETEELA